MRRQKGRYLDGGYDGEVEGTEGGSATAREVGGRRSICTQRDGILHHFRTRLGKPVTESYNVCKMYGAALRSQYIINAPL